MALNIDKYKQLPILKGTPNPRDLKEGVPVFRFTHQGIIQFIKYRGQLYNTIFEPTKSMHKKEGFISEKANGGSFTFKQGFKIKTLFIFKILKGKSPRKTLFDIIRHDATII